LKPPGALISARNAPRDILARMSRECDEENYTGSVEFKLCRTYFVHHCQWWIHGPVVKFSVCHSAGAQSTLLTLCSSSVGAKGGQPAEQ